MATPLFIAQVVQHSRSGLPEDDVVNTMHFEGDEDPGTAGDRERWDELAPGLADRLVTFYQSWSNLRSPTRNTPHEVKLYDFRDAVPRIPRYVEQWNGNGTGQIIPAEVAVCISFRAALQAGTPAARRRGRIYLGPFNATVIGGETATAHDARPWETGMLALMTNFKIMARGTSGAARLAVYSPTTDLASSVEDSFNDVTHVWIDDAFDTVRSRGARATSRIAEDL